MEQKINVTAVSEAEKISASDRVEKRLNYYTFANLPPIKNVVPEGPVMVVESPIYETSVSEALKRYNGIDDTMFPNNNSLPMYGDFTNMPNIAEATLIVNKAKEMFFGLPAEVRARFNNDFNKFGTFINQENFDIETLMTDEFKNKYRQDKKIKEASQIISNRNNDKILKEAFENEKNLQG